MVLKGEFTIGFLQFVVRGIRTDTQHFIGILKGIAFEVEHRVDLTRTESHPLGTFLQSRNFTLGHMAIGLGHHHEVVQKLQTLRIVHLLVDLSAALQHRRLELLPTFTLLFVEQFVQDLIALADCTRTKILAKHLAHQFHL